MRRAPRLPARSGRQESVHSLLLKNLKVMNPRRVHELMKAKFPKVDLAKSTWVNLLECDGALRSGALVKLIDQFINAEDNAC